MAQLFANNAYGVLAGTVNGAATLLVLVSGQGARFPAPTGGDHFLATLVGLDGNSAESVWEIVKCTGRSTDQLTVVRAQEGTTATTWNAGTRIELRWTKAGVDGKENAGVAVALDTAHTSAPDPHPQYTTTAEAAAAAPVQSVAGKTGTITLVKADVGLGNVDNTTDLLKPISTATQAALNNNVATTTHAATSKTTPADADELGITDSAASWGLKKLTFANLTTWLSGLFVGKTGPQVMSGDLAIRKPDSTTARVQTQNVLGSGVSGMGGINAYEVGSTTSTPVHIYAGGLVRAVVDPASGNLTMAGGALGYGSASYGTAVQPTSLTADVVINKPSGEITMFSGIPPGGDVIFSVISSTVALGDLVLVSLRNALTAYSIESETANAGYFRLRVRNVGGGTYIAPVINFAVIKEGAA